MRRTVPLVTLVAIVGAVLLTGPAAAQINVHVVMPAESLKVRFLDFGRPGIRMGDRVEARGTLLDATGTSEVGKAYRDCIAMSAITAPVGGLYRCSYVLQLEDGDLVIEGLDPHGPGLYTIAVLGGTGAYAGAVGEATLTDSYKGIDFSIDLTA